MKELSGKVAVITGAASGIGLATACSLSRRGVHVVAVDLNATPEIAADISDQGTAAIAHAADVSNPNAFHEVRDAALYAVTPETARDHLRVWVTLLRGAPDEQVPDTAAVTGFCAWQAGEGALAWCALDRCFEVDPEHLLGLALAECLVRAVPPTAWTAGGDRPDGESGTA